MPSVVSTPTVTTDVVLDPVEEAPDRVELALNEGAIRIAESGPDWGTAEIAAYMADRSRGSSPVDFRVPNRQIQLPLIVNDPDPTFYDLAMRTLQAKVSRLQQEGGILRRGDGKYVDIVNASLVLPDRYGPVFSFETDIVLSLECVPDFYGPEQVLSEHTAVASSPDLVFTESDIEGDFPARVRIVVSDEAATAHQGLLWGVRSRHYDPAVTARLGYEAEALSPVGGAAIATRTGASGGASNNVVRHTSVGTDWTAVLNTDLAGVGLLTHTGRYAVWARVWSADGDDVSVRLVWEAGSIVAPASANAACQVPGSTEFFNVYLGEIGLGELPVGLHCWQGQIQAKGATSGLDIDIDRVWFQPLDEGAGRLVAESPDAVIFTGRTLELRTDGCYRETVGGGVFSPLVPFGDLPRLPPSGLEDRLVEVFLKPSRGDFAQLPDYFLDTVFAQLRYRPCWLFPV